MTNWKNLTAVDSYGIYKPQDIPSKEVEALLFKMTYQLLKETFDYDYEEVEDSWEICEAEDQEVTFRTLEEFGPQHLCDFCTFTLIGSEDLGYNVTEVIEKDNPQNKFFILRTATGNPMGIVCQKDIEEPVYGLYDGTIEQKQGSDPLVCQALNVIYKSRLKEGLTVKEWLKGNDTDIQYYQGLVDAL